MSIFAKSLHNQFGYVLHGGGLQWLTYLLSWSFLGWLISILLLSVVSSLCRCIGILPSLVFPVYFFLLLFLSISLGSFHLFPCIFYILLPSFYPSPIWQFPDLAMFPALVPILLYFLYIPFLEYPFLSSTSHFLFSYISWIYSVLCNMDILLWLVVGHLLRCMFFCCVLVVGIWSMWFLS